MINIFRVIIIIVIFFNVSVQAQVLSSEDDIKFAAIKQKNASFFCSTSSSDDFKIYAISLKEVDSEEKKYTFDSFLLEEQGSLKTIMTTSITDGNSKKSALDWNGDLFIFNFSAFKLSMISKPISFSAYGAISRERISGVCKSISKKGATNK